MKVKVAQLCLTLCDPMDYSPWNSPGQKTGVGSLSLLRGSSHPRENSGLLHCRWILYQLSHKGSARILEWIAYPFSGRSSQESNWGLLHCRSYQGNPITWSKKIRIQIYTMMIPQIYLLLIPQIYITYDPIYMKKIMSSCRRKTKMKYTKI